MHEILVNRLGGLSLHRKSVVRLTGRPDMTLDVYRGRKTTIQHTNQVMGTINGKFHQNRLKTVGGVAETRLCLWTDGHKDGRTNPLL